LTLIAAAIIRLISPETASSEALRGAFAECSACLSPVAYAFTPINRDRGIDRLILALSRPALLTDGVRTNVAQNLPLPLSKMPRLAKSSTLANVLNMF
jgi:hypothetical protein